MVTLKYLEGRVTIVLTPELRELALARLGAADYADDGEALVAWFDPTETPNNHVLDAAYSEAEGLMVSVIVDAINDIHTAVSDEPATSAYDEHVRVLSHRR